MTELLLLSRLFSSVKQRFTRLDGSVIVTLQKTEITKTFCRILL